MLKCIYLSLTKTLQLNTADTSLFLPLSDVCVCLFVCLFVCVCVCVCVCVLNEKNTKNTRFLFFYILSTRFLKKKENKKKLAMCTALG